MKKQALAEIKKLDIKAIREKVKSVKIDLQKLVLDKSMNKLTDVKVLAKKRKDLAQMLTILRQKELLMQLEDQK